MHRRFPARGQINEIVQEKPLLITLKFLGHFDMSSRTGADMSHREKLLLMDTELKSFYEYCQQAGFTDEEMEAICRPLTNVVRRVSFRKWFRIIVAIVFVIVTLYGISNVNNVAWHASAIGRIFMIRILPIWDWTPLFYKPCLISKNQIMNDLPNSLTLSDCAACEAVASVQHISETDYDNVLNQHLIRGAPVIVTDANLDWSLSKYPDINLTRLLSNDERLRDSVPCILQTNLRTGKQPADLNNLLTKITNIQIPNWFVHFQNCDLQAVKSLRVLAPRPYFLSPHVPPAHFNWLLMSDKYSAPRFKRLELDTGLIILSQLKGSTLVQLTPRNPCEDICPVLTFDVRQSETLVLANSLWNFEYIPDENGENTAILTETAWNEA